MRNQDGLLILDFSVANKLAIANTFFQKSNSRLITFSSGGNHTQIDYILVRKAQLKSIKDTTVNSSEECITQHKLLVCDLVVSTKPIKPIRIPPRRKTWKLRDPDVQKGSEQAVLRKCQHVPTKVEGSWSTIKNGLLKTADETCGWTQGGCPRHKETWWWNNEVDNVIKEKHKA